MILPLRKEPAPLRKSREGTVMVGDTRVPLATVIRAFNAGASPEQICLEYPTVSLADAYAVVSYYLRHREEVDAYMAEYEREEDEAISKTAARGGRIDVQELIGRRDRSRAG
jgi:uncharacterized protein (DUF433 family)